MEDIRRSKLKSRFRSMWNNVRFVWTLPTTTNFSRTPIWLLGRYYHAENTAELSPLDDQEDWQHFRDFRMDFSSRPWLTYRNEFPRLEGTSITSDAGWGCMLRSGQMLLAETLVRHFLGRDWRVQRSSSEDMSTYRELLRWFADVPSERSPFGVHSLVSFSVKKGRCAGQWFGPAQVSYLIRDSINLSHTMFHKLKSITVYVAQDCTVYKKDVEDLLEKGKDERGDIDCAVLVLIPIRLGGESLNEMYFPCIKGLLSMDWSVGIMGGRPTHSLFFVGWQDDKLIYLDPHYCQSIVDVQQDDFPLKSFHCAEPRRVSLSRIDPSCTLAFYCKDKTEFQKWCHDAEPMIIPPKQRDRYPFFTFHRGRYSDVLGSMTPPPAPLSSSSHNTQSTDDHHTGSHTQPTQIQTYSLHLHAPGDSVPLRMMGMYSNDAEYDSFVVVDKTDGRTDKYDESDVS